MKIVSVASAVPENVVTNDDLEVRLGLVQLPRIGRDDAHRDDCRVRGRPAGVRSVVTAYDEEAVLDFVYQPMHGADGAVLAATRATSAERSTRASARPS